MFNFKKKTAEDVLAMIKELSEEEREKSLTLGSLLASSAFSAPSDSSTRSFADWESSLPSKCSCSPTLSVR